MPRSRILQLVVLAAGLIVALIAFVSVGKSLGAIFATGDLMTAGLAFVLAFAVGLASTDYDWETLKMGRLVGAGIALGIALFCLVFAFANYRAAAGFAVWLGVFAVLNLFVTNSLWTRPLAIAAMPACILWLMTSTIAVDQIRELVSQWTLWLTSLLLDTFVIPHVRLEQAIQTIVGESTPQSAIRNWDGVIAMMAFSAIPIIYFRRSLLQAVAICFSIGAMWILLNAGASWWTIWQGGELITAGSGSILFGIVVLLFSLATAMMVGEVTDAIPMERSDLSYPVTTYFWNFFTQFPTSLFVSGPALTESTST